MDPHPRPAESSAAAGRPLDPNFPKISAQLAAGEYDGPPPLWQDQADGRALEGYEQVELRAADLEARVAMQAELEAGDVAERRRASGRSTASPFWTAREIVVEVPPTWRYVARPWLVPGTITELDGKPKAAGKTTFLLQLVRAVLDGAPFLGEPTERTPVVLLTEQSRRSIAPTLAALGLDREDLLILTWPDAAGLTWPQIVAQAVEQCERIGASLLVIDTVGQFARLAGDAENDAGAAMAAMAPLQLAAAEHDLAILIARHDRKAGGEIGESGRGSNAWTGAVDCVMALRRQANPVRPTIREIEAISRRDDVPGEPLVIELTPEGFVALGSAGAVAFSEARERLRQFLSAAPDVPSGRKHPGATMDEIAAGVEAKRTILQDALRALVESGEVERFGEGKRGDPFTYSIRPGISLSAGPSPLQGVGVVRQKHGAIPAPVAGPGSGVTIDCRDYRAHQLAHRLRAGVWTCAICQRQDAVPADDGPRTDAPPEDGAAEADGWVAA